MVGPLQIPGICVLPAGCESPATNPDDVSFPRLGQRMRISGSLAGTDTLRRSVVIEIDQLSIEPADIPIGSLAGVLSRPFLNFLC
jgi:hypothetical protein